MYLSNFLKFRWKKSELSVLPENWHTWYLGGADFKSTLRFLKFLPQDSFLGKFGHKKFYIFLLKIGIHSISRMLIHTPILFFSEFPILNRFLGKFRPKKSKLFVLPENWRTEYLRDVDSYSDIGFLNF